MRFEEAVSKIPNITDLRRVARAHVVDHRQLSNDALEAAILKSKPQYVDGGTIEKSVHQILHQEPKEDLRALAYIFLVDVLLEQYDTQLPEEETDERVIGFEQRIVDRSNEVDLQTLACGEKNARRHRELELYQFVLAVAWENRDSVSPDEANLLHKLRKRLVINQTDHRILEAHLGKFPRWNNETHNRNDIADVRKRFQEAGLVFPVRGEDGIDRDVIPNEIASPLRAAMGIELRREAYLELLDHKLLRKKAHLREILEASKVTYGKYDTLEALKERVVANVPASRAIASSSPRFGLNSDELSELCKDLGLAVSGSMQERVDRVLEHYANLRPRAPADGDERELWFRHYEELAFRDYEKLREQHIIDKDLEIEHKFEEATRYLFDKKLGHALVSSRFGATEAVGFVWRGCVAVVAQGHIDACGGVACATVGGCEDAPTARLEGQGGAVGEVDEHAGPGQEKDGGVDGAGGFVWDVSDTSNRDAEGRAKLAVGLDPTGLGLAENERGGAGDG
ncbi:MAG: SAP domain-containing protein [Myxococcota bacterium]